MKKNKTFQKNIQFQDKTKEIGRSSYSVYLEREIIDRINDVIKKRFYDIISEHQMIKLCICVFLYGKKEYTFSDYILIHDDFKRELTSKINSSKKSSAVIEKMIEYGLIYFED